MQGAASIARQQRPTRKSVVNWREAERLIWAPPEELSTSQWAEKYRVLTAPSEEKGPLRLIRTPYLAPIMDAFDDPDIEEVIFCKPAQIAGTEAMISVIGRNSHDGDCPIMLILADEDTSRYMCDKRIRPMFRNSEELARLIIEEKFNLDEITLSNGSYIAMAWASSVAKLASRPIKIVLFDEIDKPGYYVTTKEASPLSLGVDRTESYYNRKIGKLSTPTIETGNIWKELNSCDVIYDWHVPCPFCGQYQPLRWNRKYATGLKDGLYRADDGTMHEVGHVVWDGGRDATSEQIQAAGYRCGECGEIWNTIQKNQAVERGKMIPRTEIVGTPKKVGFHINRIYSLLGKSGDIPKLVSEWISVQGDPGKLQGFINSTLAEPWRQIIVTTTETKILKAKCELPPQTVPQDAVALTCGIDHQKYGFWFVVRAWARDYTSWLIHYGSLATWDDVEELVFEKYYPVQDMEIRIPIWRAAVDTGGGEGKDGVSMTEEAYWWIRHNGMGRGCRVWGTKGASRELAGKLSIGKPLDRTPSGKPIPGGLKIISLDTNKLKNTFHYRLNQAIEKLPHAAYLHAETGKDYAMQILAEEKQRGPKGFEEWVQLKDDNHLLDCEVMCSACADPEWEGGGVNLLRPLVDRVRSSGGNASPSKGPVTSTARSKWLQR